jgi:ubiquinone/menaquinone biosynthesis C-methylase UbiE
MAKEHPSKPRFKQTAIYDSMNKLLIRKGVFRGVHLENLGSVLDIGCGEAPELSFIAKNYKMHGFMVGIDVCPHPKWKSVVSQHNYVNFVVASAHYLPLRSDIFDFVFLKDLLHHVSNDHIRVIREAYAVVRNLGMLRVIEANRYSINPILVFKSDRSHDHFTFEQMSNLKKHLSFDELYGFELLPSFSNSKRDSIWNFFVIFFWFSTTWPMGRRFLSLYIKMKEKLMRGNLTYYVLSKKKMQEGH